MAVAELLPSVSGKFFSFQIDVALKKYSEILKSRTGESAT